ncbi:hypothetical protein AK812_SmicGene23360 [Symbiodinium microadriaticum]|uniref:Uncharacterized protein n=1 Tax=Symbiodinium microadriaticum TaxID=2951 RepID=A0A1Q9DHK8_SYMMI|nr:hypothetical protein AK812_SmicGene23360 [Symbiodinium microadriaticum]
MVWPLPLNTNITHLTWACHTNVARNNKPHGLAAASVLLPGLHYNAPTGAQSRLLCAGQPSAWVSGSMTGNGKLHDARSKRRGGEGASSRVTLFPFLQSCRMVSSAPVDVALRATQQLQEALPRGRTPWGGRARNAQEPHEFCRKTSSASKRSKLAKAARRRSLHNWSANVGARRSTAGGEDVPDELGWKNRCRHLRSPPMELRKRPGPMRSKASTAEAAVKQWYLEVHQYPAQMQIASSRSEQGCARSAANAASAFQRWFRACRVAAAHHGARWRALARASSRKNAAAPSLPQSRVSLVFAVDCLVESEVDVGPLAASTCTGTPTNPAMFRVFAPSDGHKVLAGQCQPVLDKSGNVVTTRVVLAETERKARSGVAGLAAELLQLMQLQESSPVYRRKELHHRLYW